nr:hypothetical protein [Tanacetum cinerariifolium]
MIKHYCIHISQLFVIGAAEVSHFEILCRVYDFEPTIGLFCCFYVNSKNKGWISFNKRQGTDAVCYTKALDSLKGWNDHFSGSMPLLALPYFRGILVRIGERQRNEDEPKLLETTIGRVVSLLPVALDHSLGELEASMDKLFDVGEVKQKTKVADACEPSHPAKKLRDDYGAPGGPIIRGKSQSSIQCLLAGAVQNVKVSGGITPTLPLVSSFFPTTPEREGGDHTELLAGANLRAIRYPQIATTTTPIAEPATIAKEKLVSFSVFGANSPSAGSHPIPDGFSDCTGSNFLIGGIRTVFDPDSNLQKVYVPQWNMTNGSCFDDGGVCRKMVDEAARHMSLSAEVHIRVKYNIRERRSLNSIIEEKDALLKVKDEEIESLKAQLVLKEAEAAEAIRLCIENSGLDLKVADLIALVKVREQEVADLDAVVTSVHKLETSSAGLQEQVTPYENYLTIGKAVKKGMQDGLSARITHGAEGRVLTDVAAYNPSTEANYLNALQRLQSVNFSLITELKCNKDASIDTIIDTIINLLCLEDSLAEKFGLTESHPC